MRVADYIAEFLHAQRVQTIFMLSGTGSIFLDDALANHSGMRYICARHEGAAVVMAKAEAQLTGGLGAAVVTTGPGGINAIAGVAEAWVDSIPVIVLSGQVERHLFSEKCRTFGIQGFNIVSMVKPVTKYAAYVDDPATIRFHLEKAVHLAKQGRPGPVWLDIPLDVQAAVINPDRLRGFEPAAECTIVRPPVEEDIVAIEEALRVAKRPLLIVGQGVRQAGAVDDFILLADRLRVPVLTTRLALDMLPYSVEYNMGLGGVRGRPSAAVIKYEADVVLCLGTSLSHSFVGEECDAFNPDAKVIVVDTDNSEVLKAGATVTRLVRQDVRLVIRKLLDGMQDIQSARHSHSLWLERCVHLKRSCPIVNETDKGNPINSYHFIERLDLHSGPDDIFISDAGSAYYITGQALTFEQKRRELTSGSFATMGMTLPLAIGTAATLPDRRVIAITGDGSIETNIQELRTISENRLGVKLFVINNGGYASIRDSQDASCGGRYTDSQNVLNFKKVAAAFELPYYLIDDAHNLDSDLKHVLSHPGAILVEVVCDPAQRMVRPEKSANDENRLQLANA